MPAFEAGNESAVTVVRAREGARRSQLVSRFNGVARQSADNSRSENPFTGGSMARTVPALAFLLSTFCCVALADRAAAPDSLYSRLGGPAKVNAFVSDSVDAAAAGAHDQPPFTAANLGALKQQLAARICLLSGGRCDSGPVSLELGDAHIVALIESLRTSMRAHDVPLSARNELLEVLAPMPWHAARR
jgi:hypothetical protein